MAGIQLDFKALIFVCFGVKMFWFARRPRFTHLLSPGAGHSATIGEKNHYNSLGFMTEMMAKWRFLHAKCVGDLFVDAVLEKGKAIAEIHSEILKRYEQTVNFFGG